MKQRISQILAIWLGVVFTVEAQDRMLVGVNTFSSNKETKYVTTVTNKVIEMMYGSDNYDVLDRSELQKIMDEHHLQAGEEFMDSEITVEQGKLLKTKYLMSGNIEIINITRKRNAQGGIMGYWCSVVFTVKILEVETNRIKAIQSFTTKKGNGLSPETSISDALASVEKKLKKYFEKQLL